MDQLLNDIRHGTRILTKSPGLSATAALLVALVKGAALTTIGLAVGATLSVAVAIRCAAFCMVSPPSIRRPTVVCSRCLRVFP
jgi:hypothetical protein